MSSESSGAYEVRFIPASNLDRLRLLYAEDDLDAVYLALMARDDREIQIWLGSRLVASYPAKDDSGAFAPSTGALPTIVSPVSVEIH